MGGGSSTRIEQTFNLKSLNKTIFNQVTINEQSLSAANNNIQEMRYNFGNIGSGCTVNLSQTIDATLMASGKMSPKVLADTKTKVSGELQASATAAITKATEMGNMQFGDRTRITQNVNAEIEQIVEQVFDTTNINKIYSEIVNLQEQTINVGNCDGEFIASQNVVAELVAEAITESITSAIANNAILSQLAADAGGSTDITNKGLSDLVGTFFEGLTGPMKYGIIASIVCCCLLVVLLVVIGLSPAGQSATRNMGSAAARRF